MSTNPDGVGALPDPIMPAVDTSTTPEDGEQPVQDPYFVEVEVDPADAVSAQP